MRSKNQGWLTAAAVVTGMVLINTSACLPKDYLYNFAAAGRTSVLSAFADAVFNTLTTTLFPAADNGNDNGNDNLSTGG